MSYLESLARNLFFVLSFIQYQSCPSAQQFDKLSKIEGFNFANGTAVHIEHALQQFVNGITNYEKITKEFQNISASNGFEIRERSSEKINNKFVDGMEKLFNSKTKILQNIKNKAENLKKQYKNNPDIEAYSYLNIRELKNVMNESVSIVTNFSATVPINLSYSFVQIPTNIYSGDKAVLNTAAWTQTLDEAFKENYVNHSDSSLLYQYYGDASGFFRVYPGNLNGYSERNSNNPDLYDCRRRIWYIQASSSPKDVIIMIDTSGSMIGNNIGIAKIAAAALIDTLNENDYFNVITINKSVTYVQQCAKHLIQATKENSEMMKRKLHEIGTPSDITDIDKGLTEAFDILESGSSFNRTSADCNKAIMFITDGVEGEYAGKDTFEKRNAEKSVRVFTFLVGRVKNPYKKALVKMSCENRGFFYAIQTLGSVWDTVLDYLNVFSRSMTSELLSKELSPSYSPLYLDSSGMGMITSASLGVFHRTEKTKKLIGVVGTDISLHSLEDTIPLHELGTKSYVFVINNNGFVFMHPDFRPQTGYLPDPQNILIEDLERSLGNETVVLKMAMLDNDNSMQGVKFKTYYMYDDGKKLTILNGIYSYKPINSTELTAATVVPDTDLFYFDVKDEIAEKWLDNGIFALYSEPENITGTNETYSSWTITNVALWDYCELTPDSNKGLAFSSKYYPNAKDLYDFFSKVKHVTDIPKECNKDLIKRLLLTAAVVTEHTEDLWTESVLENKKIDIDTLFVLTNAGYSKYFTKNNITREFPRDSVRSIIFEIATAYPEKKILVSAPHDDAKSMKNAGPIFITTAGVSRIKTENKVDILTAVSGMNVSSDYFFDLMSNATKAQQRFTYNEVFFDCYANGANESLLCAIIDYSGFIIASNQGDKYNGRFFGEITGSLVNHLVEKEIFQKVKLTDTQAICDVLDSFDSAARFLLTPAKLIFDMLSALFKTTSLLFMKLVLFIVALISQKSIVEAQTLDTISVSCQKETPFYNFNEQKWLEVNSRISRDIPCEAGGNARQQYAIQLINNTNLFFLIASLRFSQCRYGVSLNPVEIKHEKICDHRQEYRRKPKECYNETKPENDVLCGTGILHGPSLISLVLSFALSLLIRRIT